MRKNNIAWVFNDHSIERFFERTFMNTTKKDITKAIKNNQIIYFKRINSTRSMAYIHAKKEIIKIIIHRRKGKIITILPWNSIFQYTIKIQVLKYDNKIYRVNLFPDCYLETKKPNALTKIFEYHGIDAYWNQEGWMKIKHDHPLHDELFNLQKERSKGNETFEIEGKAKKIESIVQFGIDLPKSYIAERS